METVYVRKIHTIILKIVSVNLYHRPVLEVILITPFLNLVVDTIILMVLAIHVILFVLNVMALATVLYVRMELTIWMEYVSVMMIIDSVKLVLVLVYYAKIMLIRKMVTAQYVNVMMIIAWIIKQDNAHYVQKTLYKIKIQRLIVFARVDSLEIILITVSAVRGLTIMM
jgi:hypothetical protein